MTTSSTKKTFAITKVLSANDSGETGTHQAGILIPKQETILSFFPHLGIENKNPRINLSFSDKAGQSWEFSYIYYNNKFFGGTRNEFRLTGITRYLKQNNLKAGDSIQLSRDTHGIYTINFERMNEHKNLPGVLKLGSSWKVVKI